MYIQIQPGHPQMENSTKFSTGQRMDWRNHKFVQKHLHIEKARMKEREKGTSKERGLENQKGGSSGSLRVLYFHFCCRELEMQTAMVQQKLHLTEIEMAVQKGLSKLKAHRLPVNSYSLGWRNHRRSCLLPSFFL